MSALKLTYEERQAITVIRKAMRRRPEIASALMEGMTRDIAYHVLLQAKHELASLNTVTQAFITAASTLTQLDKENDHD
jgi:hypothetical protein